MIEDPNNLLMMLAGGQLNRINITATLTPAALTVETTCAGTFDHCDRPEDLLINRASNEVYLIGDHGTFTIGLALWRSWVYRLPVVINPGRRFVQDQWFQRLASLTRHIAAFRESPPTEEQIAEIIAGRFPR